MPIHKTVTTQTHVHWAFAVFGTLFMLAWGMWLGLWLGETKGTKTYYNGGECRWVVLPHNIGATVPVLKIVQEAEGELLLCKKPPIGG